MKYRALQEKRQFITGKIVVGIDPGKDKHQAAILDPNGLQLGKPFRFQTNHVGYTETLWKRTKEQIPNYNPNDLVFAVETSCNLWQTISYYLHTCGYTVLLVSPLTTHHSRPFFNHDFSRTDPKDALLVASNTRDGYFDFYQQYTLEINAMHRLSITYDKLKKDLIRNKSRLRSFLMQVFPEFLSALEPDTETARYLLKIYFLPKHFIEMDIEKEAQQIMRISHQQHGLETLMKLQQLAKSSVGIPREDNMQEITARITLDSWLLAIEMIEKNRELVMQKIVDLAKETPYFEILTDLKGISYRLAALFIAETRDPAKYDHYKKLEKFSGLNIRQSQSGKYVGARHISHLGNSRLSWILYKMTEETSKYIPEVRIKYLKRQLKRRVHRKNVIASIPVLLKLIVRLIKENRKYQYRDESLTELEYLEYQYQELKNKHKRKKVA